MYRRLFLIRSDIIFDIALYHCSLKQRCNFVKVYIYKILRYLKIYKPLKAAIAQQITTIIGLQKIDIILAYQEVITLLCQSNQDYVYHTSICYHCNDLQLKLANISSIRSLWTLNSEVKP